MPRPSIETLRELLDYCPDTGVLRWRRNRGGRAKAGTVAGSISKSRPPRATAHKAYIRLSITGRPLYAHVVAYAMHTGAWPAGEIDHINGDGCDNRALNLREVSHSANIAAAKDYCNNTSGYRGVSWHRGRSKWHAQINRGGVRSLGYYTTPEEAYAAYLTAREGYEH